MGGHFMGIEENEAARCDAVNVDTRHVRVYHTARAQLNLRTRFPTPSSDLRSRPSQLIVTLGWTSLSQERGSLGRTKQERVSSELGASQTRGAVTRRSPMFHPVLQALVHLRGGSPDRYGSADSTSEERRRQRHARPGQAP